MGTIIQFFQGHCKQFAVGYLWETCVLLYPEAHPRRLYAWAFAS